MCCRMVDDIWAVSAEDILDTLCITYRSDQHDQVQLRILPKQLLLDLIGIVLIDVYDDQLFRLMSGDLPAQLAAATGDQYDFIFHIIQYFFGIDLDRISAQEVFDLDFF